MFCRPSPAGSPSPTAGRRRVVVSRRGARGRWTAAVLAVPGAAALFGLLVGWAEHTLPAAAAASRPTSTQAQPTTPGSAISSSSSQDPIGSMSQPDPAASATDIPSQSPSPGLLTSLSGVPSLAVTTPSLGHAPAPQRTSAAPSTVAAAPATSARPAPVVTTRAAVPPPVHTTTSASGAHG